MEGRGWGGGRAPSPPLCPGCRSGATPAPAPTRRLQELRFCSSGRMPNWHEGLAPSLGLAVPQPNQGWQPSWARRMQPAHHGAGLGLVLQGPRKPFQTCPAGREGRGRKAGTAHFPKCLHPPVLPLSLSRPFPQSSLSSSVESDLCLPATGHSPASWSRASIKHLLHTRAPCNGAE